MSSAINKKEYVIYSYKTGEIVATLDKYEHDQKIQKAVNAYKWANKHEEKFVFAHMEAVKDIISVLTRPQRGLLLLLQTYADYEGILRNTALRKRDKTVMTNADIMKVLGISKQTYSDFLSNCLKNHIIIKGDGGCYKLNNKYHFRGKMKDGDNTVKIWRTEVRSMKDKVSYANLGLLYDLIPHIHFTTNTICANPYETDPTKIKKLNKKEICELLDISHHTFNRLLVMIYDGKAVLAEVKILRKYKSYLINPWVFYRLDGRPNDGLIEEEVDPYQPEKTLRSIFSLKDKE
ncbi:hypothetical protein MHB56_15045 [Paenibacillus sp. FSL H8-0315]|jgi:hypothetical protein|uniref:hypothetical protein n=1 Tax=Paenibacillus sp. FSL H8-0315 TaxID=2921384 RepID=UPI0030F5D8A3